MQNVQSVERATAFSVQGLTKIYGTGETQVHALRGVDLDLPQGELTVLLGPSGSGKSTFLNILGGLDSPTGGTVTFQGRDITALDSNGLTQYRRDHVGFVFQFYNLIPSLTARENVSLVTEIATAPLRPDEALELVGLSDRMDHFPAQLSGGEQQMLTIARTLMGNPQIILLDEPSEGLAPVIVQQIAATIRTLAAEGLTVLLSEQNVRFAMHVASRAAVIERGRILVEGPIADIAADEGVREAYLTP